MATRWGTAGETAGGTASPGSRRGRSVPSRSQAGHRCNQCHEVGGGVPSEYVVMATCLTPWVPPRAQSITGECGRPTTPHPLVIGGETPSWGTRAVPHEGAQRVRLHAVPTPPTTLFSQVSSLTKCRCGRSGEGVSGTATSCAAVDTASHAGCSDCARLVAGRTRPPGLRRLAEILGAVD
jgi:hypothetical protein